ncbi:MAG: T9SS type A sorting domain-containing protein [Draconibacterium sp.]
MKRALLTGLLGGLMLLATGQIKHIPKEVKIPFPVCKISGKSEKSFVPPPLEYRLKSSEPKCDIVVTYNGFPDSAKVAFEHAVGIWETILESEIPIHIYARWYGGFDELTLASCGPEAYYTDFPDTPYPGCYYAVAVAEKIAKQELNGNGRYDVLAYFGSEVDWYYGIDGDTPAGKYDLVTVALHEIAHGLGFFGFFFVNGSYGSYGGVGLPIGTYASFDLMVEQAEGKQLLNTDYFGNPSVALKNALVSGSLFANSPVAKSSETGLLPGLYAPATFSDGSSVYHLDDGTYGAGTANALMTHAVSSGEANHNPGPLAQGIMEDVGWTNLILHHSKVKDKEQVAPLDFDITIDSYYDIPENASFVVYSTDNFSAQRDTLPLLSTGNENEYTATLQVNEGTDSVEYYVVTSDVKGRVRTSPWNAPEVFHTVVFGTDSIAPVITHNPIPYFWDTGNSLEINADVDDNLGVDTVFVNYSVNGATQQSFGLNLLDGTTYGGIFNFDYEGLNDGDVVSYEIVTNDASSSKNQTIYPPDGQLEFKVEQIFDPVTHYTNDFNTGTPDFIISDFSIYTADNFSDNALQSSHPYLSSNEDNKDLNFSTLLKHPVIIQEDGEMTFDEVVLVEPGGLDDYGEFQLWDYVVVEGSKDTGQTWIELSGGYDASLNTTWLQNYRKSIISNVSQAVGQEDWFVKHEISLVENGVFVPGDTILIRFRLYSDPYATGWGWTIDNLVIQQPVSAPVTKLSPGSVNVYPNPFTNVFNVEINSKEALVNVQIEIFDSFGRNIYSKHADNIWTQYSEQIDLQEQASGMFLLRVSENGKPVLSKKLIKN